MVHCVLNPKCSICHHSSKQYLKSLDYETHMYTVNCAIDCRMTEDTKQYEL